MDYLLHVVSLIGIYAILSVSLGFAVGQAGVVNVAHASFYGIGAYATALLMLGKHAPFPVALLAGSAIASLAGLVLSWISSRVGAEMLVLTTFGFAVVLTGLMTNWSSLTGGPSGIPSIPDASFGTLMVKPGLGSATLIWLCTVVTTGVIAKLTASPFGRVLRCIREDELLGLAIGRSVVRTRSTACAISSFFAGLAGGLFATFSGYIDPSSFSVSEGILVLSMVIIGGTGSTAGSALGAALLVGLPEGFRLIGVGGPHASNIRQILYGALIIILMIWRPKGILGRFELGGST